MQPTLAPTWQMLVLRGALGILLGILAIAWPISTALALITLFGLWALVDGAAQHQIWLAIDGEVNRLL